jgi:hypothetical protein
MLPKHLLPRKLSLSTECRGRNYARAGRTFFLTFVQRKYAEKLRPRKAQTHRAESVWLNRLCFIYKSLTNKLFLFRTVAIIFDIKTKTTTTVTSTSSKCHVIRTLHKLESARRQTDCSESGNVVSRCERTPLPRLVHNRCCSEHCSHMIRWTSEL